MSLERFIRTYDEWFTTAKMELQGGKKVSHWSWFIFPQMRGLGESENSYIYGIENLEEAEEFIMHPLLGSRLIELCAILLLLPTSNPISVMGTIDSMKLRSSMTLFAIAGGEVSDIFIRVLDKYFDGQPCELTLKLLKCEWFD